MKQPITTILCLLNTLLMVIGQTLFKIGSNGKQFDSVQNIIKVIFSPVILLALTIYAGTTILWLYILSKTELSFAYPIQALAFPLVLIISSILFHEQIPIQRWAGIALIFAGVYIAVFQK